VLTGCAISGSATFGRDLGERIERRRGGDANPTELATWLNEQAGAAKSRPATIPGGVPTGRSRALLKIQNGCTHGCSYCVVPLARGAEKSLEPDSVHNAIEQLRDEDHLEIVLTGVQLGSWGHDLAGQPSLSDLVASIAQRIAPARLRLSSIEPWSLDENLSTVISQEDRICPHLHVPLQSGSDSILEAMRRGYTAAEFIAKIESVRNRCPDIALGTDVILGFPGETTACFDETLRVLETLRPSYVHAFPYSPRSGTDAAAMPASPGRRVARERVRIVRSLAEQWSNVYRESQIGRPCEVLVEQADETRCRGISERYLKIEIADSSHKEGSLVTAYIDTFSASGHLEASAWSPKD